MKITVLLALLSFSYILNVETQNVGMTGSHSLLASGSADDSEAASTFLSIYGNDTGSAKANSTAQGAGAGSVNLTAAAEANINNGTDNSEGVAESTIVGSGGTVTGLSNSNFDIYSNLPANARRLLNRNLATAIGGKTNILARLNGKLSGPSEVPDVSADGEQVAGSDGDIFSQSEVSGNAVAVNDSIAGDLFSTGLAAGLSLAEAEGKANLTLVDGTGSENIRGEGNSSGIQGGAEGEVTSYGFGNAIGGSNVDSEGYGANIGSAQSNDSAFTYFTGNALAVAGDNNGSVVAAGLNDGGGAGASIIENVGEVEAKDGSVLLFSDISGNQTTVNLSQIAVSDSDVNDAAGKTDLVGYVEQGGQGTENVTGKFNVSSEYNGPNDASVDVSNSGGGEAIGTGAEAKFAFLADGALNHNNSDVSEGIITGAVNGTADSAVVAGDSSMGFKSRQILEGRGNVRGIGSGQLRTLINNKLSAALNRLSTTNLKGESDVTVDATGENTEGSSDITFDSGTKNTKLLVGNHTGLAKGANNSTVLITGTSSAGEVPASG